MFRFGELYETEYREAIWRSKINLSFLTKSNQDEYTHKSFEIAACGGFLLAERCAGHSLKFKEDEEAVFFSDTEELIAKIRRYLPDEAARTRIAAAGQARALRDGYYNDVQVGRIVDRAREIAREGGRDVG
jgi:spore maturation protein CgeB